MIHPLPSGWQEVKLGDIATIIKVKNKENKNYPVLSNSAIYGVVLQEEYFYKKIASKNDTTNYYIVDIGNFIYNPRISENAPAGPINVNKLTKGIVSPLYTVFHVKKEYSDSVEWRDKMYTGIIEQAGRDHLIISDPSTGKWYLLLMIYLDYVEFNEKINYKL